MSGTARLGFVFGLFILMAACGGGDAEKPWDVAEADTATEDAAVGEEESTTDILMGSGFGDNFVEDQLKIAVTSLSAGGMTSVSASLADADGNLYQEELDVLFSSECAANGLATVESPVTTVGGVATTSYQAQGCSGTDTVTAIATVNDVTLTATGTLTVQPAIIGSLRFVSADPANVGLKGIGLVEVSRITFEVLDTNGNPAASELVTFELNTDIGGISLSSDSATSDANGLVHVDVSSGNIATVVRVTATLASNTAMKTQSDVLVISTGIADQNSMSVSAEILNPEAWNYDGVTVPINVYIADHFNNPVPDGTRVSFTTEGGQIEDACFIENGGCSVNWTSSNPRPMTDGRVTILAHMQGEESFLDVNGNGVFDAPDTPYFAAPDGLYQDMPEAFIDINENGVFDLGVEEFMDFNNNASYDTADGNYNGILCCDAATVSEAIEKGEGLCLNVAEPAVCDDSKTIHVRESIVLVMSGSHAYFTYSNVNPEGTAPNILDITGGAGFVDVLITDLHGQILPNGTTIDIASTNGEIKSRTSFVVPNTNALPGPITVSVAPDENKEPGDEVGELQITVLTPKGTESYSTFITIVD